jgi:DNA-binding transcriptional MerR regulator
MNERLTVPEAAKHLGLTEGAVRQRVQRGSLESDKDENGRVYIYVDSLNESQRSHNDRQYADLSEIVEILKDQTEFLRRELEARTEEIRERAEEIKRKDSIIMALTQRIPELEAASEARESVVSDSETDTKGAVPQDAAETEIRQSWWRRLFGG